MSTRIQASDIPQAIITPTSELSAGRGWAELVKSALPWGDQVEIAAINAVDGLLNIEIAGRYTSRTASHIEEARASSAAVCEICGESGILRRDAGWLRTRCDQHANDDVDAIANVMRTTIADVTDWENAAHVGRECGADWLRDDLAVREKARRDALWARGRTVAKLLWSDPSDIREQSRLEDALEQLHELIKFS